MTSLAKSDPATGKDSGTDHQIHALQQQNTLLIGQIEAMRTNLREKTDEIARLCALLDTQNAAQTD